MRSGERFIFYDALFLQKLKQKTADDWSLVGILAHEVGHHVYGHTLIDGHHHKFELQADYFAGFVLRRLGATLDQAHAAMREISPERHPNASWARRPVAGDHPRLDTVAGPGAAAGPQGQGSAAAGAGLQAAVGGRGGGVLQGGGGQHERRDLAGAGGDAQRHADGCLRAGAHRRTEAAARCAFGRKAPAALADAAPVPKPESAAAVFNPSRAAAPLTPAEERALKPGHSFRECNDCPEMVVVPAGSFMMGSPRTRRVASDDEGPQHKVTIARPFAVGKFEVTFAEWDACVAAGGCKHRPER